MHIPQQTNVREEWDKPNTFPNKQSLGRFVCFSINFPSVAILPLEATDGIRLRKNAEKTKKTRKKSLLKRLPETPEKGTKKEKRTEHGTKKETKPNTNN